MFKRKPLSEILSGPRRYNCFYSKNPCAPNTTRLNLRFSPATGSIEIIVTHSRGASDVIAPPNISATTQIDREPWPSPASHVGRIGSKGALRITSARHTAEEETAFTQGQPSLELINRGLFLRHLRNASFQAGTELGLWRLIEVSWPHVVFALGHKGNRRQAAVRFLLDRYPEEPPILELWNARSQSRIEPDRWPIWFLDFLARYYPVALIEPAGYESKLLRVSLLIAKELNRGRRVHWDRSGDITQCLIPLSESFCQASFRLRQREPKPRKRSRFK